MSQEDHSHYPQDIVPSEDTDISGTDSTDGNSASGDNAPPAGQVGSSPPGTTVHIHITDSSFGQFNAQSLVQNIASEISGTGGKGEAAIASALQADLPPDLRLEPADSDDEHISDQVDWGEAPRKNPFYGRGAEIDELADWITADRRQVIAILGIGGIGKSALAVRLAEQIAAEFDYIYWRSLQHGQPFDAMIRGATLFFSGQRQTRLPGDIDGQIARMLRLLRARRCLLVLDNFDTILQAGAGRDAYMPGYEGYGELLRRAGESAHQSCLIVTSREKPKEISVLEGMRSQVRSISLDGLREADGRLILEEKGLSAQGPAMAELVEVYAGNPLALKLVSEPIREIFSGSIASFLAEGEIVFGDIRDLLHQQFQRLSEQEREVLYWLAVAREGNSLHELHEGLLPPRPTGRLLEVLGSLRRRSLVDVVSMTRFSMQPVIMEYVTEQLIDQVCDEVETGELRLFTTHSLISAQGKDYVRESQQRLIMTPVIQRLSARQGNQALVGNLTAILPGLRAHGVRQVSYVAGNVLNMLIQMGADLKGLDCSGLAVRGAYLKGASLPQVNFSFSELTKCAFTETFGGVLGVAVSPDGSTIAVGTASDEIRMWDAATGTALRRFAGHTDWVYSVVFGRGGTLLASASDDQTVRIWDVRTGDLLRTLTGHLRRVRVVAFSPDGAAVASTGDDQTVRIWSVDSGQLLATLNAHERRIWFLAFHPAGTLIATASEDRTIGLWDPASGEGVRTLSGHEDWVRAVCFSPDGRLLASGGDDNTIRLWDVAAGREIRTLRGHDGWVRAVTFAPGGRILASGSEDHTVRTWDVESGDMLRTLEGHTGRVRSVDFSPDGETLVSGSEDQSVRIWEVRSGQLLKTLQGHNRRIISVAFSPDSSVLASGSEDQSVQLWSTHTGEAGMTLHLKNRRLSSVAFSPDGGMLATSCDDHVIRVWNVQDGRLLRELTGHERWVWSVAFSPDGSILASGSDDKTARLWSTATWDLVKILAHENGWAWTVAFSPDGSLLASGSDDQTVRLWDVEAGEILRTLRGHSRWVWSVAFSPDGSLLASGSDDQTVRLWEVQTGRAVGTLSGHAAAVRSVAFCPRTGLLASGSDDQTVRLWDTAAMTPPLVMECDASPVRSVAFSPNGAMLASGSYDGVIRMWDPPTGERVRDLMSARPYQGMNISGVTGLTEDEKSTLLALGAVEN